jgi:hypothetical protein
MLGLGCLAGQVHFEHERLLRENENNINSWLERKEPMIKRCHVEHIFLRMLPFPYADIISWIVRRWAGG